MDYEKRFKDVLNKFAYLLESTDLIKDELRENIEHIFPELAESEDERIRKEIIDILDSYDVAHLKAAGLPSRITEYIAWLKKQCENANFRNKIQIGDKVTRNRDGMLVNLSQLNRVAKKDENQENQKPADKVEPKFKVGDWLVHKDLVGITCCITQIHTPHYYLTNNNSFIKFGEEDNYRQWTIQDAKNGDVLCCESGWTCIFKTLNIDNMSFSSYCFMDNTGWFCETGSEGHTLDKAFIKAYNGNIYPATKEQRDLLFQKMHEAGYEWNAEKKELKKIEQKPAWSEEDEKMYNAILRDVRNGEPLDKLQYDWLKSLKDRVQPQPKQEWSEEDESCLITIINELEASKSVSKYETKTYDKLLNWLKSLRPQKKQEWSKDDEILLEGIIGAVSNKKLLNKYQIEWLSNLSPQSHWKPSEEQIKAVRLAISFVTDDFSDNPTLSETLNELLEQLKNI